MKITLILIFIGLTNLFSMVRADTHAAFETTRVYSTNRQYFLEIKKNQRVTLYRNNPSRNRIWTHTLQEIPLDVLLTDDARRVVLIDQYYGNKHVLTTPVITILNEKGEVISIYTLQQIANLERVSHTISSSHWYGNAEFSESGYNLLIKSIVQKCEGPERIITERDNELAEECNKLIPYENLTIDLETGKLMSRENIEGK